MMENQTAERECKILGDKLLGTEAALRVMTDANKSLAADAATMTKMQGETYKALAGVRARLSESEFSRDAAIKVSRDAAIKVRNSQQALDTTLKALGGEKARNRTLVSRLDIAGQAAAKLNENIKVLEAKVVFLRAHLPTIKGCKVLEGSSSDE
jgi:hypothetical protein